MNLRTKSLKISLDNLELHIDEVGRFAGSFTYYLFNFSQLAIWTRTREIMAVDIHWFLMCIAFLKYLNGIKSFSRL